MEIIGTAILLNTRQVFNIWEKDRKKKELAEKEGFNVIYIWEDEIKKSSNLYELVYNKIEYKK